MNLKLIKLAGFKTFVDPTLIPLPSQWNGIVGPNGCGKSNIVDAIRWVIGESSAKQLRGQSMTDVIFNGSNQRKPVGKASVELVFDNSQGRIGGEFAKFGEIAVRREVHQEGQAQYFLNGTGCRRRDIIDIFLGTGLGPRSYAIVEQGMISQLIEAKPEELRAHLEEAAGISRYKERRRETENRIRHTQENLARLHDILEELDKQLRHLKRQASAAERYKELKQQERLLQAQVKALQWRDLAHIRQQQEDNINQQQLTADAQLTKLRQVETQQSILREQQIEWQDQLQQVQQRFYQLTAAIARDEQQINHSHAQNKAWQDELAVCEQTWQELQENSMAYAQQQQELIVDIDHLQPTLITSKQASQQAQQVREAIEANMQVWQQQWDQLQRQIAQATQQQEVAKTKHYHVQQQLQNLGNRRQDLQQRYLQLNLTEVQADVLPLQTRMEELSAQLSELQQQMGLSSEQIQQQRSENQQYKQIISTSQQKLQQQQQRYAALQGLQQAALGQQNDGINRWLQQHEWQQCSRLGQQLTVQAGWELALETVLSGYFDAVCLQADILQALTTVSELNSGKMTLIGFAPPQNADAKAATLDLPATQQHLATLASCVTSDWPIVDWLQGIYIADDLATAVLIHQNLGIGESVITREGVWLGKHWLRISKTKDQQTGVLVREQQLRQLQQEIEELQQIFAEQQQALQLGEQQLLSLESQRDLYHRHYQQISRELTEVQSTLSAAQSRLLAVSQQQKRLTTDLEECEQQLLQNETQLLEIAEHIENYNQQCLQLTAEQQQQALQRDQYRGEIENARQEEQRLRQHSNDLAMRLTANEKQLAVVKQMLARDQRQFAQVTQRRQLLSENLAQSHAPLIELQEQLQEQLEQRVSVELELKQVQQHANDCNQQLDVYNKEWQQLNADIDQQKLRLQELQMQHQETSIRQTTIAEHLAATDMLIDTLLAELPEQTNINDWELQIEQISARIARLGAINLAAIEEYQTINERKSFLDKQFTDLNEALEILTNAIRKIDRETRVKFRETFDQVNTGLQTLFPQIFGGGKAELILAEEDLLTAGIIVKAQPPGKRNASVHLLSGGEKALTAISLVFALFQLNPAPFCILDEVDAPLDDLNVGRFCKLVKLMSQHTQFIVVSHNKVTMSFAEHLLGVTMQEAGVSRIVSVDMQQAVAMVEV